LFLYSATLFCGVYNPDEEFTSYDRDTHRMYTYAIYSHVLCRPIFLVLMKIVIFQEICLSTQTLYFIEIHRLIFDFSEKWRVKTRLNIVFTQFEISVCKLFCFNFTCESSRIRSYHKRHTKTTPKERISIINSNL
jgi:hypothetical protein